uniref:Probable nicotinate-nucleotide pyrophosphorylase [carboxylating] n=1 Tax=Candidatus Kentrum sp. TUN TaxID=2126343 RepID=A0A451A940_9GAMM|nr:MAG: nicotinate-nucleotide pyrophosphorylase [carboxylating] [Candidatus Kentron sp. TUN]VFK62557.1 MAG: nicotinate-nucleotide pyrophosphorylase [carboxylating] [Candidatus Kentron sp. TUN]VFK69803.1 MAG: nicotinate-nucleotide pyrophosphorylase [carboxylating] [Candidatus Kentron sp. TUN]
MTSNLPNANPNDITETVRRALTEDVGSGDITSALLPTDSLASATLISRENAVLCGIPWFDEVFRQLDHRIEIGWEVPDGADIHPDQVICRITGPAPAMLTGERTALNFLQTLSGTATLAREYANEVRGTGAKVLDTRKTIPGLRIAQKYAVRCGGCHNHRLGLYDGILIKENHILAAGSVSAAVRLARERNRGIPVEVEVESLDECREALASSADIILLDNLDLPNIQEAVRINAGQAKLEVSGNVDLTKLRRLAETGVDYISIGSLTKHVRAVDFSLRFEY